jgi:hypothetical protein
MCRTPIPHDYLERPELVQVPEPSSLDNGYQWFYEGRNGKTFIIITFFDKCIKLII